jgi:hypothetical protein
MSAASDALNLAQGREAPVSPTIVCMNGSARSFRSLAALSRISRRWLGEDFDQTRNAAAAEVTAAKASSGVAAANSVYTAPVTGFLRLESAPLDACTNSLSIKSDAFKATSQLDQS